MPGKSRPARHISLIGVGLALALLLAFVLFIPSQRKFVILERKTGRILYYRDVKPGDTFTITYTHSINKSPVDEIFEIGEDYSILLKKTVFHAFGVGTPAVVGSEIGKGQTLSLFDDRVEIDNINKPIEQCVYFVGLIANHKFTMDNIEIPLKQLTEPQKAVQFDVRRIPLYITLRGDNNV